MTSVNLDHHEQLILNWLQKRADSASNEFGLLKTYDNSDRHDVYDNSVAAILFDLHKDTKRAEQILDCFITKMDEQDSILAASYYANGSIKDGRMDAGNNAWVCIALAFHGSKISGADSKYMVKAQQLKDKLKERFAFTPSFDPLNPHCVDCDTDHKCSSVEHATDLAAVGRLCKDSSLLDTCQKFVSKMWVEPPFHEPHGAYATGTTESVPAGFNYSTCPVDCQTWTLLADADLNHTDNRDRRGLAVLQDEFYTTETHDSTTYHGVRFSDRVTGIQMENTASSSMAIAKFLREDKRGDSSSDLENKMNAMVDTLKLISSKNNGAVLACVNPNGIDSGFGYSYYPTPHLGATAWTGLLLGYLRPNDGFNPDFNPYRLDKIVN